MCAEVGVRLPRVSALPGFKGLCRRLKLQAHVGPGGSDEGMWDVSNLNRLGPSEVEQVNAVISGTRHLIDLELRAEKGEELDLSKEVAGAGSQGSGRKLNILLQEDLIIR